MEFLKEFGYSENDILDITDNNCPNIIDNLNLNKDNVTRIIDYLLEIGILKETIKEMFIYQVGIFFKTLNEIKISFDEYELDSIVKSLNYDINNIELIDFI